MLRRRPGPLRLWLVFSAALLAASLATGYRASRAARAPQYFFTKTEVVVEVPYVPADPEEAAIEAAFAEAGSPTRTVREVQPMVVLGLDLAVPAILLSGLLIGVASCIRRRIAGRARPDV